MSASRAACALICVLLPRLACADVASARVVEVDGAPAARVLVGDRPTILIRADDGELTALDRAEIVAGRINRLLKDGIIPEQITFREMNGETALVFGDVIIATADRPSAELEVLDTSTLAEKWRTALVEALLALEKPSGPSMITDVDPDEPAGTDETQAAPIERHVLPNGLTVLLWELPDLDSVAVRVTVKSGSLDEGDYLGYGLAHVVGRAVLLGTRQRSREQVQAELTRLGGSFYIETRPDAVHFQVATSPLRLIQAVDLLADLVQNATLPPSLVQTALQEATAADLRRSQDAMAVAEEQLRAAMFRRHPVRHAVEGRPELRTLLQREQLLSYYNRHYVPENVVFAVVGDMDLAATLSRIEDAFAHWPYRPAPIRMPLFEPPQVAPRRSSVAAAVPGEVTAIGWRTVPAWDPAAPALQTLAALLTVGTPSRLTRALTAAGHSPEAIAAHSRTPGYDAGYFAVLWAGAHGQSDAVAESVRAEVNRLRAKPVTEAELEAAVERLLAQETSEAKDASALCERLTRAEVEVGAPDYAQHLGERLRRLDAEALQTAARRYLSPERSTEVVVRSGL